MEIRIDEAAVAEQMQKTVDGAIASAFSQHSIKQAIEVAVGNAVLTGALTSAITDAVSKVDLQAMTASLATQLQRTVTSGVSLLIQESVVDLIYRLQGNKDFEDDKTRARKKAEIRVAMEAR